MPMIDVYAAAGTFGDRKTLAVNLASAVMRWEGVPAIPLFKDNTAAFIHDLPPDALANVSGDGTVVRVQVLTPVGVLDRPKQLGVVRELTDIVAAAAGDPTLVDRTWVPHRRVTGGRLGDRRPRLYPARDRRGGPEGPRQGLTYAAPAPLRTVRAGRTRRDLARTRTCRISWSATRSNGSRLCSARLSATAPSHDAISVAANDPASAASSPPCSSSSPSRDRHARKIRAACSRSSGDSVATVTASTAQPASRSERTRTSRQMCRNHAATSSAGAPAFRSRRSIATAPAASRASPISWSLPSGKW